MNPLALAIAALALLWFLVNRSGASVQQPQIGGGNGAGSVVNPFDNLMQGIANAENVNPGHNNPGAIMSGGKLANYPDVGDGWDAELKLLQSKIAANPQWDFYDLAGNWVNGDTQSTAQNANNWAENVAGYIGVDPTSSVAAAIGNNS